MGAGAIFAPARQMAAVSVLICMEPSMAEDIVIEPMTEEFIVWRCLHDGPLTRDNINRWKPGSELPWERYRERNVPLLRKLTNTCGACAIVARDGDTIAGHLRFYPKAVCNLEGAGGLCLQQDPPAGPADSFTDSNFPSIDQIGDKTLVVHCIMTGSSQQKDNPYQQKGIGTRMVRTLIRWAKAHGWESIEADSFEDIPIIYEISGCAGDTFWEKLGFRMVDRHPHPDLQNEDSFVRTLVEQAVLLGIPPERAKDRLIMRLDLA